MVATVVTVGNESELWLVALSFVQELFDSPAEAARVVGVNGLKDEQDGASFEEADGANEGGDASSIVNFAVKFGRGRNRR